MWKEGENKEWKKGTEAGRGGEEEGDRIDGRRGKKRREVEAEKEEKETERDGRKGRERREGGRSRRGVNWAEIIA